MLLRLLVVGLAIPSTMRFHSKMQCKSPFWLRVQWLLIGVLNGIGFGMNVHIGSPIHVALGLASFVCAVISTYMVIKVYYTWPRSPRFSLRKPWIS